MPVHTLLADDLTPELRRRQVAAILANAPPQTAVPTADLELALREWDQFPNVFRRRSTRCSCRIASGRRDVLGRTDLLTSELEALGLEIAAASGLGGRTREKIDADRVRRNVSMAFTRAIDCVRDEHDVLGRHLRNSISPGLIFRCDPERDPDWLV